MPKAYSYLRFSTPEQMKGDSKRRQSDAARNYATEHGLDLDTELTFEDLGVSAFKGANSVDGQLGVFRDAIDKGYVQPGSYLLVESLDRLSRLVPRKALRVLEDIIDRGVTVVTLSDRRQYDASTIDRDAMNLFAALLIFARAHEESATKSARLKAVNEHKRKVAREGKSTKPFTRRLPHWIEWNDEDKAFRLIPERAPIVRRIFECADAGQGKQSIAADLNAECVPVFGNGQFWHKSYIDKVLNNPACAGIFVPHKKEEKDGKPLKIAEEPIRGYFPAAVPQDLYERVTARESTAAPKGRHNGNDVTSIVAGVAKCGICGSSYVRVSKGKYVYLVCSRANAKAGCQYLAIPYADVEGALREHMPSLTAEAPKGGDTSELERQIVALNVKLEELQSDGQFLTDEFRRTRSPTLSAQIAALDDEVRAVKEELAAKRSQRDAQSSKYVTPRLEALAEALNAEPFDVAKANDALKVCVKTLEFNPRGASIGVEWQTGYWAAEGIPLHTRHEDMNCISS